MYIYIYQRTPVARLVTQKCLSRPRPEAHAAGGCAKYCNTITGIT